MVGCPLSKLYLGINFYLLAYDGNVEHTFETAETNLFHFHTHFLGESLIRTGSQVQFLASERNEGDESKPSVGWMDLSLDCCPNDRTTPTLQRSVSRSVRCSDLVNNVINHSTRSRRTREELLEWFDEHLRSCVPAEKKFLGPGTSRCPPLRPPNYPKTTTNN